jgi:cob(I)alamin adenosyltransferase
MSVFYTRKGDDGRSLIGKKKIYKLNPFVVALGELDELNSFIGIIKSLPVQIGHKIPPSLKKQLHQVQEDLFIIQANVSYAMLNPHTHASEFRNKRSSRLMSVGVKEKRTPPHFSPEKTKNIESIIDEIEKQLKPVRKFIISGTTHTSAWLDYLRALSRSVERAVLAVTKIKHGKSAINPDILPYLNRLSSLFFALARWEARDKKERHPKYK